MKPMLELFFRLQNQCMVTSGAQEKDGDYMLSSLGKEKELSKEAEGGLEEQKKGDATQLFILMSTVHLLRHVVFITMSHYLSSVKD